jgi:hypothetical protein
MDMKRGRAPGAVLSFAGNFIRLPGPGGLCDDSARSADRHQAADPRLRVPERAGADISPSLGTPANHVALHLRPRSASGVLAWSCPGREKGGWK